MRIVTECEICHKILQETEGDICNICIEEQHEIEHEEWKKIQAVIVGTFKICPCQRKIKTIVDNLYEIYQKLEQRNYSFTGTEWLLIAMMDKSSNLVTHGINCEYPILNAEEPFWKWIIQVKDSPYLKDN